MVILECFHLCLCVRSGFKPMVEDLRGKGREGWREDGRVDEEEEGCRMEG